MVTYMIREGFKQTKNVIVWSLTILGGVPPNKKEARSLSTTTRYIEAGEGGKLTVKKVTYIKKVTYMVSVPSKQNKNNRLQTFVLYFLVF